MVKVLMLGVSRNAKGGIASVVNNYYKCGLDDKIKLKYIETINDRCSVSKILKMFKGFFSYAINVWFFDVVHIHMASRMSTYRKSIYIIISKIVKKKVIIHIHGAEFNIFYEKECSLKRQRIIKKIINSADKIIVLSEEWKNYFSKIVNKNKIIVLNNSVFVPNNFIKKIDTKKFLFLGEISKRKGIYDLLEVFSDVIKFDKDVQLLIGGDGEVIKVKKFIMKNKLEKNIKLLGWLSNSEKNKYLKKCSFSVLPSYAEGMPMSILEAMAYKNIVISTRVGGIPEIIQNNKDGILINPGDTIQLYDSIILLLTNSKICEKLSNNAYAKIRNNFNINDNIIKLINIYKDIY